MVTNLFLSTQSSRSIRTRDLLFLDTQLQPTLLRLTALLLLQALPLLRLKRRLRLAHYLQQGLFLILSLLFLLPFPLDVRRQLLDLLLVLETKVHALQIQISFVNFKSEVLVGEGFERLIDLPNLVAYFCSGVANGGGLGVGLKVFDCSDGGVW